MTFPSSTPPPYSFREEHLFARDRARLVEEGISEQEIDAHKLAIEMQILPNPFEWPWSAALDADDPTGTRVAISEPTESEPNALTILYRVEGTMIRLWRVRRRDR
ncbi:MAG: hypothetical protein ABSG93_19350 [Solirubrobacteraceae bacterium]